MPDIDLAFNRNQPRWPKGHPLGGQWKGALAKRLIRGLVAPSVEAEAAEFFRKLSDPKPGDVIEVNFGFGDWRLTAGPDGVFTREIRRTPSGPWTKAPGEVPPDMIRDVFGGAPSMPYKESEAYKKYLGIDPDKFLKRRRVADTPGWTQTTPDVAFPDDELAGMLWQQSDALIFRREDGHVTRILGDDRFSDSEIRTFLAHTGEALDLAKGISPAMDRRVEVLVHQNWPEPDGVKGFVRPAIPDQVNINPSALREKDETRLPNYWDLLHRGGASHFMIQGETIDPQTYFVLHELGHIDDARRGALGYPHHPTDILFHASHAEFHSRYGGSDPAEGFAEAFVLWALAVRDGPVSKKENARRGFRRMLADAQFDIASEYADRYSWKGEVAR